MKGRSRHYRLHRRGPSCQENFLEEVKAQLTADRCIGINQVREGYRSFRNESVPGRRNSSRGLGDFQKDGKEGMYGGAGRGGGVGGDVSRRKV